MGLCLSSLGPLGLMPGSDSSSSSNSSNSSSSSYLSSSCILILIFIFPALIPSGATQTVVVRYRNKLFKKGGEILSDLSDLSDLTSTSSGSLS
jgi:hypothetical protein